MAPPSLHTHSNQSKSESTLKNLLAPALMGNSIHKPQVPHIFLVLLGHMQSVVDQLAEKNVQEECVPVSQTSATLVLKRAHGAQTSNLGLSPWPKCSHLGTGTGEGHYKPHRCPIENLNPEDTRGQARPGRMLTQGRWVVGCEDQTTRTSFARLYLLRKVIVSSPSGIYQCAHPAL